MKKFLVVLMVFCCLPAFAQQVNYMNTGALINASTQDSTFVTVGAVGSNLRWFRSKAATSDTIYTKWIHIENVNADFSIEYRTRSIAGTDTVTLYMEIFRGYGTPDSTGITRHTLASQTSTDTTMTFYPPDSTWVSKRLFSRYRLAIFEETVAAMQNDYILNVNQYSPTGRSAVVEN